MSKYKLTELLNEYIGGGRIGTLKISFRDLVDRMEELEKSDEVIVREKSGPSGDGKVNREFEVVARDSAVPGGNKQERGFTVYDYKFGFDPGDIDNYEEEYNFSVGGNDIDLARKLIGDIEPFGIGENGHVEDFADEIKEEAIKEPINLKDALDRYSFGEILDTAAEHYEEDGEKDMALLARQTAAKFRKMLDDFDGGIKEEKKMDADEVIAIIKMMNPDAKEDLLKKIADMGKKVDEIEEISSLKVEVDKDEVKMHLDQYRKGAIDGDDLAQAIEEIVFGEIKAPGMKESTGPSAKAETEDDVVNVDKVAGPSAKGKGYSSAVDAERSESGKEQDDITQTTKPMYKESLKISEIAENMYIDDDEFEMEMVIDRAKEIAPILKGIDMDIIVDFVKTHRQDIRGASDEEIRDEFENFRSVNYDYIDEDLKQHFKRFK